MKRAISGGIPTPCSKCHNRFVPSQVASLRRARYDICPPCTKDEKKAKQQRKKES